MIRYIYQFCAFAGLAMMLITSVMHYFGSLGGDQMKTFVFLGTMLWFAGAIPWLGKKKREIPPS